MLTNTRDCTGEAEALGFPEAMCSDYLTNRIFYELGDSEIAGMNRFYELAQKHIWHLREFR